VVQASTAIHLHMDDPTHEAIKLSTHYSTLDTTAEVGSSTGTVEQTELISTNNSTRLRYEISLGTRTEHFISTLAEQQA